MQTRPAGLGPIDDAALPWPYFQLTQTKIDVALVALSRVSLGTISQPE
jgi:hypothetical protein